MSTENNTHPASKDKKEKKDNDKIWEGAYGKVCKVRRCRDDGTEEELCEKTYKEQPLLPSQDAVREVVALRCLAGHPLILEIINVSWDRESKLMKLLSPLYQCDLDEAHVEKDVFKTKLACFQMLAVGAYMQRLGMMHRDLKPLNVLYGKDGNIGVCDFGAATVINPDMSSLAVYTVDYRPPEIAYRSPTFDFSTEVFCVGLMISSVVSGASVLDGHMDPSKKGNPQALRALQAEFGIPAKLKKWESVRKLNKNSKTAMAMEQFKSENVRCVGNLLSGMLKLNPAERLTFEQSMHHAFFKEVHEKCKDEAWYKKSMLSVEQPPLSPSLADPNTELSRTISEIADAGKSKYPLKDYEVEAAQRIAQANERKLMDGIGGMKILAAAALCIAHMFYSDNYFDVEAGTETWVTAETDSEATVKYDLADVVASAGMEIEPVGNAIGVMLSRGEFTCGLFPQPEVKTLC